MGFGFGNVILDSFNHGMCLCTGVAQDPGEYGQAERLNCIHEMRLQDQTKFLVFVSSCPRTYRNLDGASALLPNA